MPLWQVRSIFLIAYTCIKTSTLAMLDTLLPFAGLYLSPGCYQRFINLNIINSFVEVAAGVICSSMPAMTSFSISHMFTNSFFTSMRSRLFHPKSSKSDKSIKFSASVKHKRANLASSFANGFHLDSFTQLRDDRCVYRDGVAFPIGTIKTTILAGEPSRDLENGTIAKSVTMEQSSDTS